MRKKRAVAKNVTNADIYGVLMDLKEDMGAVKQSSALQLEAIKNHSTRIADLEGTAQRQKGAVTVWGIVATGVATLAGGAVSLLKGH